jgi:hypothetical protein
MALQDSLPITRCPACDTPLVRGKVECVKCRLAVNKMADLWSARRAAELRGLGEVQITRSAGAEMRRWIGPAIKVAVLALLVGLGVWIYQKVTFKPEKWKAYPTDSAAMVKEFVELVDRDDDASHDKAYGWISLTQKHPDKESDEVGWYRQTFHEVHRYMTGEFGAAWTATMAIAPDGPEKDGLMSYAVSVGPETLHILVEAQKAENGSTPFPEHYGVMAIQEFPIDEAGKNQQMAAITDIVGGVGGDAAGHNLATVLGAAGGGGRMSLMQRKREYLPLVRDPNVPRMNLLQLWPARKDPVVKARLEAITKDMRYDPQVQQSAQQILDGTVPVEDLIAGHVPD